MTLKQYGKLLRRTADGIKKSVFLYRQVTSQIAADWDTVCRICPQAERFTKDALAVKITEEDV